MNAQAAETCCPRFDPAPWDERELRWENRRFVKDRVRSFFHIPLNYGAVMKRNLARIEAAGARPDPMVWLTDENSPWGADVCIEAAADVPGAEMTSISGCSNTRGSILCVHFLLYLQATCINLLFEK